MPLYHLLSDSHLLLKMVCTSNRTDLRSAWLYPLTWISNGKFLCGMLFSCPGSFLNKSLSVRSIHDLDARIFRTAVPLGTHSKENGFRT